MKKTEAIKTIAEQMIRQIETRTANGEHPLVFREPINPITGRGYSGRNLVILGFAGDSQYAGFGQWKKKKAVVRKGEKSLRVLVPIQFKTGETDENGDPEFKTGWSVKCVFGASQVDGWDDTPPADDMLKINIDALDFTRALAAVECNDRSPDRLGNMDYNNDKILIHKESDFTNRDEFCLTLYHELIHWTGHPARLNRKTIGAERGSTDNATEEMIAILGAYMLLHKNHGVTHDVKNIDLINGKKWLGVLKSDPTAAIKIMGKAAEAVAYIEKNGPQAA